MTIVYNLIMLIISIALSVASALLSQTKKASYSNAERSELEDMNIPDINEGEPIAIVFGTTAIKDPKNIFTKDLDTEPIYTSVGGGGGKK